MSSVGVAKRQLHPHPATLSRRDTQKRRSSRRIHLRIPRDESSSYLIPTSSDELSDVVLEVRGEGSLSPSSLSKWPRARQPRVGWTLNVRRCDAWYIMYAGA